MNENIYIEALINDLAADLVRFKEAIAERPLQSIFIGGGTPSLFSASSIKRLLAATSSLLPMECDAEITLEANPGSSEAAKFSAFREAGVNRLSIGVQSFNATHLQALGRVHNTAEAVAAAEYAREAGFANFNLDLMYGLPQQTLAQCLKDVTRAIAAGPAHLSCYQLTIEPNTLFYHQPPVRPDDDALWQMQLKLQGLLADAGYQQYEVSAYARAGRQCRHNLNYWQFGDYLGIGAGAHGKISHSDGEVQRYWKIKHPTAYMAAADDTAFLGAVNAVPDPQLGFEFMMNALRLSGGFDTRTFTARTGQDIDTIQPLLDKQRDQGLLEIDDTRVMATDHGRRFLDTMLQDYLPE